MATGAARGEIVERVGERETLLDQLETVDVSLERVVLFVMNVLEIPDGLEDDSRKLRVHGDERIVVDDVADCGEFFL